MSVRIFIIDDHPFALDILARRLGSRPDMEVVGTMEGAVLAQRQGYII